LPSHYIYEQNKNARSYQLGDTVAEVLKPLPPNQYYEGTSAHPRIIADMWKDDSSNTSIVFDMSQIATKKGVYTIVMWIDYNGDSFPVTSYSVFKK
jgi:hypothetical protein